MDYGFTFAFYHDTKTSDEMVSGIDMLEEILGHELFVRHVQITLTDRGSEFIDAEGSEKLENGSRKTRVVYCVPMQ